MRLYVFAALALCASPILSEARKFHQGESPKSHKPFGKARPAATLGKGMTSSSNRPTYSPSTHPTPPPAKHPTDYPAQGDGKGVHTPSLGKGMPLPSGGKGTKGKKGTNRKKGTKGMMTKKKRFDHKAVKPPTPRPAKRSASPSLSVAPSESPSVVPSSTPEIGLQPTCNEDDDSKYNICLDLNPGNKTGFQPWMNGLIAAAQRWESVVVGDVPSFPTDDILSSVPEGCTYPEPIIDDIYICGIEVEIDGERGIIGFTQILQGRILPANENDPVSKTVTVTAVINFDTADIDNLVASNVFDQTAFHEMAHTLGFGLLWDLNNLVDTSGEYNGTQGVQKWQDIGCIGSPPVEADFGPGSAFIHWEEACLQNEIMTPFLDSPQPLSNITIGSLADLGYTVSYGEADEFGLNNLGEMCRGDFCNQSLSRLRDNITEVVDPTFETDKLSSHELNHIMAFAKKELIKWHDTAMGSNSSESIKIGDSIHVLYLDTHGSLHDMSVTWNDVKDLDI